MMGSPWMPLYVADYLADTRRLSMAEHGAYCLLIMEYWRNGSLPNDERKLARIVGATADEWADVRDNVAELFQDGWKHKRIEAELAKSRDKSEAASASAKKRWQSKGTDSAEANAMRTHSEGNAKAMLSQSQSYIDTNVSIVASPKPKREKPRTKITDDQLPTEPDAAAAQASGLSGQQFLAEWRKFRDHHLSRGSLMADWSAAWRTWLSKRNEFAPRQRAGPIPGERSGVAKLLSEAYGIDNRNGTQAQGDIADFRALPVIDGGKRIENNSDDGGIFGRLLIGDG